MQNEFNWLAWLTDECQNCLGKSCRECCQHEYDWDEGFMCLNCGEQGDVGEAIDLAQMTEDALRGWK